MWKARTRDQSIEELTRRGRPGSRPGSRRQRRDQSGEIRARPFPAWLRSPGRRRAPPPGRRRHDRRRLRRGPSRRRACGSGRGEVSFAFEKDYRASVAPSSRAGQSPRFGSTLEMLAEPAALGEVAHHRIGKECLGRRVGRPLELLMAAVHVIDQILHPQQRRMSIPHSVASPSLESRAYPGVRQRRESKLHTGNCSLSDADGSKRRRAWTLGIMTRIADPPPGPTAL